MELSFRCERAAGQWCDTADVNVHAVGGSGQNYIRKFNRIIPEPSFAWSGSDQLDPGETENGYLGFLIGQSETTLRMSVQVYLVKGQFYFWLQGAPPAG